MNFFNFEWVENDEPLYTYLLNGGTLYTLFLGRESLAGKPTNWMEDCLGWSQIYDFPGTW